MKKVFTIIALLTYSVIAKCQSTNSIIHNYSHNIGSTGADAGTKVKFDASGNVYLFGTFSGTVDLDPGAGTFTVASSGGTDMFLSKFSSTGSFLWGFKLGNASGTNKPKELQVDASGNVIISGDISGTAVDFDPSAGTTNLSTSSIGVLNSFIAKYSPSGTIQFAFLIQASTSNQSISLTTDNSGNIYHYGYYEGITDFDPIGTTTLTTGGSSVNFYFAKYSSIGSLSFVKSINNTSNNSDIINGDIAISGTGEIVIGGTFASTSLDLDPSVSVYTVSSSGSTSTGYVAKYDIAGSFLFGFSLNGGSKLVMENLGISNLGEIVISGYFFQTFDFDPSTSNYFVSMTTSGGPDIFLAKYSNNGSIIWANKIASTSIENTTEIKCDNGFIYVGGFGTTGTDFDMHHASVFSNTNPSFVAKYDTYGSLFWVFSTGASLLSGMDISGSGNIATTGYFAVLSPGLDMDPTGMGVSNIISAGGNDAYLAVYSQTCAAPNNPGNFIFANTNTVCAGANTNLMSVGSGTITWYSSLTSTVAISTNSNLVIPSPTVAGTYTYYASAKTCTESGRTANVLTVTALPSVTITPSSTLICTGQAATLTASGANTYTWNTGSTSSLVAVSPTVSTNYTVTGTASTGCKAANIFSLTVSACTGMPEQFSDTNLNIYPNPASDVVFIKSDLKITSVEVFESTGKLVLFSANTEMIDLSKLSRGLFMLKINYDNQSSVFKKVIKQ